VIIDISLSYQTQYVKKPAAMRAYGCFDAIICLLMPDV